MANCESCGSIAIRLRDLRQPLISHSSVIGLYSNLPSRVQNSRDGERGRKVALPLPNSSEVVFTEAP
jgi:hypothetical protein